MSGVLLPINENNPRTAAIAESFSPSLTSIYTNLLPQITEFDRNLAGRAVEQRCAQLSLNTQHSCNSSGKIKFVVGNNYIVFISLQRELNEEKHKRERFIYVSPDKNPCGKCEFERPNLSE